MKAFGFWLLLCLMVHAEDASVLIYKIRMSAEQYQQANHGATQEQLFQRCQELTVKKAATLVDLGFLRGKLGARISMQSHFELIYPCEQEPSGIPQAKAFLPDPKDTPPKLWYGLHYTPAAFEPRDVGLMREMEIVRVGDDTLSVRMQIVNVEYLRDDVLLNNRNFAGNLIEIKHPRFFQNEVSRAFRVQPGKPLLFSAANAMKADGARDPLHYDVVFVVPNLEP